MLTKKFDELNKSFYNLCHNMISLGKIFYTCGAVNGLFIGSTNMYNSIKQGYVGICEDVKCYDTVFTKNLILISSSLVHCGGLSGICFIKSAYFSALGPVGTYRIALAYFNYTKTDDKKWIKVLTKPCSSLKSSYTSYIIKPFGTASWVPLLK